MFPRKISLIFDILACVFHFMLYLEPECIPAPVSVPLKLKVAVPVSVPAPQHRI